MCGTCDGVFVNGELGSENARDAVIIFAFGRDRLNPSLQNLSPRYFSGVIHRLSGKKPLQWITDTVIGEAKNLILYSHKIFKEIAFELHFTNPSTFARYFKQNIGCSPSEFRDKGMEKLL